MVLCGLLLACSDSFNSTEPKAYVLPLRTLPDTMSRSDTVEVAARVANDSAPDGKTIDDATVAWTTSDPNIVAVDSIKDPSGLHIWLRAIGTGQAVIVASIHGVVETVPQHSLVDTVTVTERWIAVDVGRGMACGLNVDSAAYCWRPTKSTLQPLQPEVVAGLFDIPAFNLQVGHASACVLLRQGNVPYCWGLNAMGELGTVNTHRQPVATQGFIDVETGNIRRIAAGGAFMCLDIDGTRVGCYGNATFWQLGRATPTGDCSRSFGGHPCGTNRMSMAAISIGAGENHVCVITNPLRRGDLVCWGADAMGQVGTLNPDTLCEAPGNGFVRCSDTPTVVAPDLSFIAVSAGWDQFQDHTPTWLGQSHTCAIEADSTVYCWGKNKYGQLGAPPSNTTCLRVIGDLSGGIPCNPTPTQITNSGKYKAIRAGADHTCGIQDDDWVYCWGLNDRGQLGDGTKDSRPEARRISTDSTFGSLDAGPDFTCALTKFSGAIFCWGEEIGDTPQRLFDPR